MFDRCREAKRGQRARRALRSPAGSVLLLVGAAFVMLEAPRRAETAPIAISCPNDTVPIPAGTFPIGTRAAQEFDLDERPRHLVQRTRPYCIDRTEVTVATYARCVVAGRCAPRRPAFAGDDLPMTNVSWQDARTACLFRGGRLPTEVEWEHAARGTDDRLYPWGSWRPHCALADAMYEMWGHCNGYGPSPVGSFIDGRSPYGALDLAGNVLEWVDDAWDDEAYRWLEPIDPHYDEPSASHHVVRGGSWEYDVVHTLRVSDRDGYPTDLRDATLGFRCVFDPS
jgi:formylglycine-generating enzyme required for sulfatase activity